MKKYIQLTKMFLEEELQSPLGLFLNLILSSIGIFALILLWKAIYASEHEIFGITQDEMIRYYLAVLIIGKVIKSGSDDYFKEKIESGDITSDFVKPVNYILLLFSRTVAKIILYFVGLSCITLFVSLILHISPIISVQNTLYSVIPLILAFLIGFFITTMIGSLHFFFPELRYFSFLARDLVIGLLAGITFNLELVTGILYKIIVVLPFRYIVNFPVIILTSDIASPEIINGVVIQFFWVIMCTIGALLFFKSGLKHYTAYGG
jgi:ABC-2 type transport system permease protein